MGPFRRMQEKTTASERRAPECSRGMKEDAHHYKGMHNKGLRRCTRMQRCLRMQWNAKVTKRRNEVGGCMATGTRIRSM